MTWRGRAACCPQSTSGSGAGEALASYAGGMATMLGLALAVFSRERNEDELTRKLRLEAAYWAGMIGVGLLVGINTGSFLLRGDADLYGGTGLMIALLCFHLAKFHSARRKLQKEEPAEA